MAPATGYRPDIDGLRAYAVMPVLLYHLDFPLFPGGFVGVDVFFVISGYLITNKIAGDLERTGQFSFSEFYAGRARRLFPAMFATLLASFATAALLFAPSHFMDLSASLIFAIYSLSNFYFWS